MYLGDGRLVQRQDNSEHPEIKYYLVQKLTDDSPTAQKQLIDFKRWWKCLNALHRQ